MSVRSVLAVAAAVVAGGVVFAEPAAAHASVQPVAVSVYILSAGRLGAIAATLLALTGVVIGGLALARSTGRIGTGPGQRGAVVALLAGLTGTALGALVAATASGGLGTGNGLGGAFVALLLGLTGTALGGLALTRSRRAD
ncbi:DUF6223 family protein [Kitasatospora sp. NPDC048286]|uniref:DUF6223 family protein n=1 Tax=Kitasatospora sp. NPDC048286 TaxID=3364047 RepID=UPI0037122DB4